MEVENANKEVPKEDASQQPLEESEVTEMKKYVWAGKWLVIRRWVPTFWRFRRWRRKSRILESEVIQAVGKRFLSVPSFE